MIKKQVSFMVAALLSPVLSMANPQGQVVVHGNASFTQSANQLTIHNSPNAIINWQNFNIQKNETTRFIQQNSQSTVLNRVIGQNPSQILGQLSSNGRVLVMNPNGIVFGANAIVDTQGFIASTLNLGDEDFLKGHYHFIAGADAGSVINQGFIRAGKDGNIYRRNADGWQKQNNGSWNPVDSPINREAAKSRLNTHKQKNAINSNQALRQKSTERLRNFDQLNRQHNQRQYGSQRFQQQRTWQGGQEATAKSLCSR